MFGQATLELTFTDSSRKRHTYRVALSRDIAREFETVEHFTELAPFERSFDGTIKVLRSKQLRRDLFEDQARRLGILLAQHLEDREGWHGESRRDTLAELERERGASIREG